MHSVVEDELLDHPGTASLLEEQSLERYCRGLDARLRSASGKDEAERIAAEACEGFASSCESGILRKGLERHVAALLKSLWP